MDLALSLGIFLISVAFCMMKSIPLYAALFVGLVCFFITALKRGFKFKELLKMAFKGILTAKMVVRILLLIGCLTALWRCSGTVAYFVYTGLNMVTPKLFILVAFLLPALFCLAFGSAFGVAGTAGVILMVMARSGGANLLMTAGAVMSGAFLGEHFSPASSSAILTSAVADAKQRDMQGTLIKRCPWIIFVTVAFYAVLSLLNPIEKVDLEILKALSEAFNLSWPAILPAAILLILPVFKVTAGNSIIVSCITAAVLAVTVQGMTVTEVIHDCLLGHTVKYEALRNILSGGGVISMVNVLLIVILSCANSGIFTGTRMLDPIKAKLDKLVEKAGLFPVTVMVALISAGLFCNQSISIIMTSQMMGDSYKERNYSNLEFSFDLAESTITLPAIVPWCIACSVPLATMEVNFLAIPFAVYLYAVPLLTYIFRKVKKYPIN